MEYCEIFHKNIANSADYATIQFASQELLNSHNSLVHLTAIFPNTLESDHMHASKIISKTPVIFLVHV